MNELEKRKRIILAINRLKILSGKEEMSGEQIENVLCQQGLSLGDLTQEDLSLIQDLLQ